MEERQYEDINNCGNNGGGNSDSDIEKEKEMIKFEMIEKGYEYKAKDLEIRIKKGWERVALTNTGFRTLDRYGWKFYWDVHGFGNMIYRFKTLNDAKAYVRERMGS